MAPRRAVLDGVLSAQACQELLLIARACCTVGYKNGVCSFTLPEVAAALPPALVPLVRPCQMQAMQTIEHRAMQQAVGGV